MAWAPCRPHGGQAPLGHRRPRAAEAYGQLPALSRGGVGHAACRTAAGRPTGGRGLVLLCLASLVGAAALEGNSTAACESAAKDYVIAATEEVEAPVMPAAVDSILRDAWDQMDADGAAVTALLSLKSQPFAYFSHARSTFKEHLTNTFGVLHAWGQPPDVCRSGLFHTAYSGDLFQFYVFDASAAEDRAELRTTIGAEAEQLTWLFGTVHRGSFLGLQDLMAPTSGAVPGVMSAGPDDLTVVAHRLNGTVAVSNTEVAKIVVITIADYLEQMVEVNGWRDHHQVFLPLSLYPGDGKPDLALHWTSKMCKAVRGHLEAVPPVFASCTRTIEFEDEAAARDKYWKVVLEEAQLSEEEQLELLTDAVTLNPFVAEPHLLLAQLHYRGGRHAEATRACRRALRRLYAMATAWDKRRSYASWVGFARLLHVRASRREMGLPSLPESGTLPPTSGGLNLVSLKELRDAMP